MECNKAIINESTRNDARAKYGDSEKWRNFAIRIQKNPFVKNYLMEKYSSICQYCGLPIKDNVQLQHFTYDRECVFDETIRIKHKTKKRPNGTRKVPDCEHCQKFHECVDDALYPAHAYCNQLISEEVVKTKMAK